MTPALVPLDAGSILLIVLAAIIAIVALIVLWFFGAYNSLVRLRNQVQESWHQVDVELQRRYDLIPNLVEAIKAYVGHERNTLEEVVRLRNQAASMGQGGGLPTADRAAVEGELSQAVSRLLVTVEAYPDLKANTNFVTLQEQLAETEDRIAAGRRFYNANVRALNTKIESIPTNFVASLGKFEKATYFEVNDPEVRSNPRVDFGTMSQTGMTQSQLSAQASGQAAIPAQTYQQAYPNAVPNNPQVAEPVPAPSMPPAPPAPVNPAAPQEQFQAGAAQYGGMNAPQQLPGMGGQPGVGGMGGQPGVPGQSAQQPLTDPYGNPVDPNKPYGS